MADKIMQRKKSEVDPLKVIMLAIVLLVVVVVILIIFRNIFGKQAKSLDETASGLSDYDKDGQADFFDPCPCDPGVEGQCPTSKDACTKLRKKE